VKKIVPDPPCPTHYLKIINALPPAEAMAQAATLIDTLATTVHDYAQCPPEHRSQSTLDTAIVLSQLVIVLVDHAVAEQASI